MTPGGVPGAGLRLGHGAGRTHGVDDVAHLGLRDQVEAAVGGADAHVVGRGHHPAQLHHLVEPVVGVGEGIGRARRRAGVPHAERAVRPRHDRPALGRRGGVGDEEHAAGRRGGAVGALGDVEHPQGRRSRDARPRAARCG